MKTLKCEVMVVCGSGVVMVMVVYYSTPCILSSLVGVSSVVDNNLLHLHSFVCSLDASYTLTHSLTRLFTHFTIHTCTHTQLTLLRSLVRSCRAFSLSRTRVLRARPHADTHTYTSLHIRMCPAASQQLAPLSLARTHTQRH